MFDVYGHYPKAYMAWMGDTMGDHGGLVDLGIPSCIMGAYEYMGLKNGIAHDIDVYDCYESK